MQNVLQFDFEILKTFPMSFSVDERDFRSCAEVRGCHSFSTPVAKSVTIYNSQMLSFMLNCIICLQHKFIQRNIKWKCRITTRTAKSPPPLPTFFLENSFSPPLPLSEHVSRKIFLTYLQSKVFALEFSFVAGE